MSRTLRNDLNGKKVNDGKVATNACTIKTDGVSVKHEVMESQDPAFYNPVFKKTLKRMSSKTVRKTAKTNLQNEEKMNETV